MKIRNIFASLCAVFMLTACSDEPDSNYLYTFKGEMMSQYLENRPELSQFNEIVCRVGLNKQLSAYGHYTCFAPTNEAIDNWLKEKGLSSVTDLTDSQCDTIARTHLVNVTYSTFEMKEGNLASQNMNNRIIEIEHGVDEAQNPVVILNKKTKIFFQTQNDSVENGIVHRIDGVLESSTRLLPFMLRKNARTQIYSAALDSTGISSYILDKGDMDDSYHNTGEFYDYVTGSNIHEAAIPPLSRLYGFTLFVVPDDILEKKYKVTNLKELYDLACTIYDPMYPDDVNKEEHKFEHLSSHVNPLYRFMAYHTLNRNVLGWNYLTVRDDFGVIETLTNPIDWYETLLPHTMIKVEHLICDKWKGESSAAGEMGQYYVNRRVDSYYPGPTGIRGAQVQNTTLDADNDHLGVGGTYFYIDEVLKFDEQTRDVVDNTRIRMDFSTIFPEVMTNDMRMNGDRTKDDDNSTSSYDHTFKYGRNFYFPDGYLDNVTIGGNGKFIYRRPRQGYWSLHGDEFICQGNYDITFRIPPVPYKGEWQIRLGYAAMDIRGIAQIYFGTKGHIEPQGIPLDMTRTLSHESILGELFTRKIEGKTKNYTEWDTIMQAEDRKILKNLGFYRGANGGYRTGGTDQQHFSDIANTLRIVLCTQTMEPDKDYFLRIRAVSSKMGNNNEVMLDYLELVPKSVYGVNDGDAQEDDL